MNNSYIHIRNLRVTPTWSAGTKLNRIIPTHHIKYIDIDDTNKLVKIRYINETEDTFYAENQERLREVYNEFVNDCRKASKVLEW
jgi:hypothetical protein